MTSAFENGNGDEYNLGIETVRTFTGFVRCPAAIIIVQKTLRSSTRWLRLSGLAVSAQYADANSVCLLVAECSTCLRILLTDLANDVKASEQTLVPRRAAAGRCQASGARSQTRGPTLSEVEMGTTCAVLRSPAPSSNPIVGRGFTHAVAAAGLSWRPSERTQVALVYSTAVLT